MGFAATSSSPMSGRPRWEAGPIAIRSPSCESLPGGCTYSHIMAGCPISSTGVGSSSAQFNPVGDTDSEKAFCGLLEQMKSVWIKAGTIPPLAERLSIVATFAMALRCLGPANFLYSDGDTLFAHGDRRKQAASSRVEPPGLVYLQRVCPHAEHPATVTGLSIQSPDQSVALVASVPLNDEPWIALREGEVIAMRNGEVVARRVAHHPPTSDQVS